MSAGTIPEIIVRANNVHTMNSNAGNDSENDPTGGASAIAVAGGLITAMGT